MTNEEKMVQEKVIWRKDLQKELRVTSNTVRIWIKEGTLPNPDIDLSNRTKGWKLSTLRAAKVDLSGLI